MSITNWKNEYLVLGDGGSAWDIPETVAAGNTAAAVRKMVKNAVTLGLSGNLWKLSLTAALAESENAYSLAAERKAAPEGSLKALALMDMERFEALWNHRENDPAWAAIEDFSAEGTPGEKGRALTGLCLALEAAKTPEKKLEALSAFYRDKGCGVYALGRVFRLAAGEAEAKPQPLDRLRSVVFADLVGYEEQKQALRTNTEAFLKGFRANNALLYGDAGTGKSTSIQALAAEYGDKGLRIIELYKSQFSLLPSLIEQLKTRNYRFILFMDDLSFEENETEYKALKAVLEGGAQAAPENVRIYATSNRRHLIKETWKDRDDMEHSGDIHRSDTVEEKLSLAGRFGLKIFYPAPGFEEYHRIVSELVSREAGMEGLSAEELRQLASTWQVRCGSRTGRAARQFVDSLKGEIANKEGL